MAVTIIALFSLLVSIFTFVFFDVKLKKQERLLNEYRLAEYREAEKEKKIAHLLFNTYWQDKDTLYFVIENRGPSDAFNIMIKDLGDDSQIFRDVAMDFPLKIMAGDSRQLALLVYYGMPDKTRILASWEDDSREKHQEKMVLSIN